MTTSKFSIVLVPQKLVWQMPTLPTYFLRPFFVLQTGFAMLPILKACLLPSTHKRIVRSVLITFLLKLLVTPYLV